MGKKTWLLHALITLSLALIFVGCSSTGGLITSFEDLTTETKKEGAFKLPQYRVISVPGILPFADVGSLQFYMPGRKPSTSIGLSADSSSYVLQSVVNDSCDLQEFIGIRNNLMLLREKAESYVENKINHTKLKSLLLSDKIDPADKGNHKVLATNAASKIDTVKSELDSLYKEVVNSIDKTGIIVYRWSYNSSMEGSFSLGNMLGRKNEKYNGFALLSGLRIATLIVGKDLVDKWKPHLNIKSKYANRFELTTFVMQAKYISYVTEYDLLGMATAKLKASDLPKEMKKLNMIEIEAALSKAANLSNMGFLGDMKRTRKKIDWTDQLNKEYLDSLNEEGWQTFYSVVSDLTDLIDLIELPSNNQKEKLPKVVY